MAVTPIKTPFTNMSFTPDVPSSALGAQEYNVGQNIETNVRGVNSVAGDAYILSQVPGNPIFVTSGFGINDVFYLIVATEQGHWYNIDITGITNITPSDGVFTGYNSSTVITASWNGQVVFLNDQINPPMYFWPGQTGWNQIRLYDNAPDDYVWNYDINIISSTANVTAVTGSNPWFGTLANLSTTVGLTVGTTFTTTAGTGSLATGVVNEIVDSQTITFEVSGTDAVEPTVGSVTNVTAPLYSSLTAGFVRVYNSPNVGSLLVAGNLQGNVIATGTVEDLPTTIRWSQNFGLNAGPTTWEPTIVNIANEVEIPVRGPVIDGFSLNGNFYLCSYWDTVLMSPIAYTSTSAPVFGINLVAQGRGLLNENCWAVVDQMAYGVDARDIWSFNGGAYKPIGNQRVKQWFYNNLAASYIDQVFVINNTFKNQIEIYYPDLNSTGHCNQMLSYRYDLDIWNPPRQVSFATMACEAPYIQAGQFNYATRGVVYSSFSNVVTGGGNVQLVQKDTGTSFLGNTAISSLFQRNNISFGQDYSASIQVHRVYPEIYGTGNIEVTVGGADSVASTPTYETTQTMPIVTSNPWVQITQNEARITSLQVSANTAVDSWQMTAANWQITKVQDTR